MCEWCREALVKPPNSRWTHSSIYELGGEEPHTPMSDETVESDAPKCTVCGMTVLPSAVADRWFHIDGYSDGRHDATLYPAEDVQDVVLQIAGATDWTGTGSMDSAERTDRFQALHHAMKQVYGDDFWWRWAGAKSK